MPVPHFILPIPYYAYEDAINVTAPNLAESYSNVTIRGVTMNEWGMYGVKTRWLDGFSISECNLFDIGYGGIMLSSSFNGTVSHNRIDNVTPGTSSNMYGIALTYDGTPGAENPTSTDVVVDGNTISNVWWEGLDSHGGSRLTFSNNTVLACRSGIMVDGSGTFTPKDIVITGNLIDSLSDSAPSDKNSIFFGGSGGPAGGYATGSVTGNTIRRSKQMQFRQTQDLLVSDNHLEQSNAYGIFLASDNSNFSITGNTITDVWNDTFAGDVPCVVEI